MPYRARSGGGMFGSSVYPDSRPRVDVAGAIDAAVGGASTLIRQAYARRQAENQTARAEREFTYRQTRDAATDAEKALTDRRSAIERGFVPAHTEQTVTPSVSSVGPVPAGPSAVRKAMTAGTTDDLAPASVASVAPPPPTSAPIRSSSMTSTTVPERFDPKLSGKYALAEERANDEAKRTADREQFQLGLKKTGEKLAEQLAAFKNGLPKNPSGGSATSRAMTGNKIEDARNKAAAGIVSYTKGSYDDAVSYLNSEDGKALRDLGVQPHHIMFAHGEYSKHATDQALRLESGVTGMSPREASSAVVSTRRLATPSATATTAKPPAAAPARATTAAPTPAKPAAPPPAGTKPAASARAPLSDAAKAKAQTDTAFAAFLKEKGYGESDWGATPPATKRLVPPKK